MGKDRRDHVADDKAHNLRVYSLEIQAAGENGFGCGDKLRSREPRPAAGIIAALRTQVEGSSKFYSLK